MFYRMILTGMVLGLFALVTTSLAGCSDDDDDGASDADSDSDSDADSDSDTDADSDSDTDTDSDSDSDADGDCDSLCDQTPAASQSEGDCVAVFLAGEGYLFVEASCAEFSDAFDDGDATTEQCLACYEDEVVDDSDCAAAEAACF